MTDPLTGPLSVDKHLKMVREATWDVRAQWYDIGVELGISVGTLQVSTVTQSSLPVTHHGSIEKCSSCLSNLYSYLQAIQHVTITTLLEHVLQTC